MQGVGLLRAAAAAASWDGHKPSGNGSRNGALGLAAALAFLAFVSKFSERTQAFKAQQRGRLSSRLSSSAKGGGKGEELAPVQEDLRRVLGGILLRTCSLREAGTVAKLCLMLLLRTGGSVWVARHWGSIVNSIVKRNFPRMHRLVLQFAGAALSLAVLNALLKYYIASLKREVREKITLWCHERYLRPRDLIFYKANKVGEEKIENCDHQITSDVAVFSEIFADVLSQSLKPMVDFLVYSVELSRVQGLATPLTLYAWFALASSVSTATLPPFGELAAEEQRLEGRLRAAHSHLIANCEQVAFLGGEEPERRALDGHFQRLLLHESQATRLAFNSEVVRQYLNKYFVTVIGLLLLARPLRLGLHGMTAYSAEQIAQYFTSTWRNMEAMATAIQDLFELTNRVGRLSGLASRVSHLMDGLECRPPVLEAQIEAAEKGPHPPTFRRGADLCFEHVSVYKPDGALLVRDLNFSVSRNQRVLVTGANGCGKSSLFRVIRRLWPLVEGTITMPREEEIHFLAQVNFVPVGTLRDLVTYPHSREQVEALGRTDEEVHACLEWAHVSPRVLEDGRADLQFAVEGEVQRPGLDDVRDWQKDLSPGQKQRLAFARLFYHRPSFVVLDECTNGISPDVEHDLYDRISQLGLAVFSISHKIELKLFHDFELHYLGDADGGWTFGRCSETRGKVTRSSSSVRLSTWPAGKLPKQEAAPEQQPLCEEEEGSGDKATITYERRMP